jgi:adenosylcobinamide-GDP ribazoletransferase
MSNFSDREEGKGVMSVQLGTNLSSFSPERTWSGFVAGVRSFCAAFRFLTVFPLPVLRSFTPAEIGWAVAFFPLIGGLLGAALAGLDRVLLWLFPVAPGAVLVLACWIALTGALHLDGFLDTCDGLFVGPSPDRRLEIMRDPHHGTFAFAGGSLLILMKFSALVSLPARFEGLLLAPVLGRWAMAMAIILFPYARADGLGRPMKNNSGWLQGIMATVATLIACWCLVGWHALAVMIMSMAVVLVVGAGACWRLGGNTGDVYGFLCEMVEALVLLAFLTGETI